MDSGIDDAVMLMLALANPGLEVLAVTTVSGNVSLRKATANALRIVEVCGKRGAVPVCAGASRPLRRRPVHAEDIHGSDGLGECGIARPGLRPEKGTAAAEMLAELIKTHRRKEISIVATAPLTNIATFVGQGGPSLAKKLDRIFVMGGVYDVSGRTKGNVTEHAEFNFYCDPEAADAVMSSSASIVACGLEVTGDPRCAIQNKTLAEMRSLRSPLADLACDILAYPVRKFGYCNLHDVFALFALLYPHMFKSMERCRVRVDCSKEFRGRCTVVTPAAGDIDDNSSYGNVLACGRADPAKFNEYLLQGLKQA